MEGTLRVSAEALQYLRARQDSAEHVSEVVFIGAMLDTPPLALNATGEEYIGELATEVFQKLPSRPTVRWVAWIADGSAVPPSHLHNVHGVPVAVPDQVLRQIGDRELILDKGELRFEPEYGEYAKPDIS